GTCQGGGRVGCQEYTADAPYSSMASTIRPRHDTSRAARRKSAERSKKKLRALRGSSFGANMGRYVSIKTAYESRLNALRASVFLTYPSRPFRRRPAYRHGHALRPSEPRQPSPRS